MYKVAQRIRDLREDKDISQAEIAKILNTSQTVYSRYERNVRTIPAEMIYELCIYYNVTADYIFGFTDKPKPLPRD